LVLLGFLVVAPSELSEACAASAAFAPSVAFALLSFPQIRRPCAREDPAEELQKALPPMCQHPDGPSAASFQARPSASAAALHSACAKGRLLAAHSVAPT